MKGEWRMKALESIANGIIDAADIFGALIHAGYGAPVSRMNSELRTIKSSREKGAWKKQQEKINRQRFSQMIYFLKRDGLIEETKKSADGGFSVTQKGIHKIKILKQKLGRQLPNTHYPAEKGNVLVLVSFDVPEKERRKRDWLRAALRRMGLQKVQQSLWMGKRSIPRAFLADIEHLQLIESIEIFEIKNPGTLRHIL